MQHGDRELELRGGKRLQEFDILCSIIPVGFGKWVFEAKYNLSWGSSIQ